MNKQPCGTSRVLPPILSPSSGTLQQLSSPRPSILLPSSLEKMTGSECPVTANSQVSEQFLNGTSAQRKPFQCHANSQASEDNWQSKHTGE